MNFKFGLENESYKYSYNKEPRFENNCLTLSAAKRDWAAFQVLIKGKEDFSLSVGNNAFFSHRGNITSLRIEVCVKGFSETSISMNHIGLIKDDDGVEKADLLLNQETVHVKAGKVQSVWVEIRVPANKKAGKYEGQVKIYSHRMFEEEKLIEILSFELFVKEVILPKPRKYQFYLDLWQHVSNIARKHEVRLWSNEHFRVLKEYVKSLANLGQKAITVIVSEIPWSGQRCYKNTQYPSDLFEYSMVRVFKNQDGSFEYDFSIVEKYISLCAKNGIFSEIEVFGLTNIWSFPEDGYGKVAQDFPDAIRIRYLDRKDGCYKYMTSGDDIKSYIKALEKFFIDKGLIHKVRIIADEPADAEHYREVMGILKSVAPSFKYKTAINHAEFIGEFKDSINDFVPGLDCVCYQWNLLEKMRGSIKGRLMWYVCCAPKFPNTFISSHLLECRLIGILTAFIKFDGFLRWSYTVWPEDPRKQISFNYPAWPAGDTNFVYPANNGKPLLTLRYKNLKRGIEDFELIWMLREKTNNSDEILQKYWSYVLRTETIKEFDPNEQKKPEDLYSLRYEDYSKFKNAVLDELEKLSG
ncbi:MAG TPA: DUF4091 domain-containing protein [Clostridiaceae bacterium]|nr:DUF4091 domain-containing protein [Clostridiaceae bacterium]